MNRSDWSINEADAAEFEDVTVTCKQPQVELQHASRYELWMKTADCPDAELGLADLYFYPVYRIGQSSNVEFEGDRKTLDVNDCDDLESTNRIDFYSDRKEGDYEMTSFGICSESLDVFYGWPTHFYQYTDDDGNSGIEENYSLDESKLPTYNYFFNNFLPVSCDAYRWTDSKESEKCWWFSLDDGEITQIEESVAKANTAACVEAGEITNATIRLFLQTADCPAAGSTSLSFELYPYFEGGEVRIDGEAIELEIDDCADRQSSDQLDIYVDESEYQLIMSSFGICNDGSDDWYGWPAAIQQFIGDDIYTYELLNMSQIEQHDDDTDDADGCQGYMLVNGGCVWFNLNANSSEIIHVSEEDAKRRDSQAPSQAPSGSPTISPTFNPSPSTTGNDDNGDEYNLLSDSTTMSLITVGSVFVMIFVISMIWWYFWRQKKLESSRKTAIDIQLTVCCLCLNLRS